MCRDNLSVNDNIWDVVKEYRNKNDWIRQESQHGQVFK